MFEKEILWPYGHRVSLNLWMGDGLTRGCKNEYGQVILQERLWGSDSLCIEFLKWGCYGCVLIVYLSMDM